YERETFVEEVFLAPSERAVVDVLFDAPGTFSLEHRTPDDTYVLGHVVVNDDAVLESFISEYEELRRSSELSTERARLEAHWDRAPDKTLAFTSLMPLLYGDGTGDPTATLWTCPMHPEIVRTEPGNCPICGMKLVPK